MEIVVAKNAGFCFGVKRATDSLESAIRNRRAGERIYTLGALIHNETYNKMLREQGVEVTDIGYICKLFHYSTTIAPTCVAQGYDESTCSVCGYTEKVNYTAIAGHKYETTYSYNNSFHWLDCKYCDEITSYAEHNIDDFGYCTVCNQPLAPTEGVLYELSADRTYATVVGYEGTSTDIVISNTYKGVPVTVICEGAFIGNNSITSVVIPDSVTYPAPGQHGCRSCQLRYD